MHTVNKKMAMYGDLDPERASAKARRAQAMEAINRIAGSEVDGMILLRDLCGHDNKTTSSLAECFSKAGTGKDAFSRLVKCILLKPLCHLSVERLKQLGMHVGRDLLNDRVGFLVAPLRVYNISQTSSSLEMAHFVPERQGRRLHESKQNGGWGAQRTV